MVNPILRKVQYRNFFSLFRVVLIKYLDSKSGKRNFVIVKITKIQIIQYNVKNQQFTGENWRKRDSERFKLGGKSGRSSCYYGTKRCG